MTVIALGSVRGAPGVSTLAWSLALTWPTSRRLLLVEADPAGGVLAARLGRGSDRGWASLAATGRHHLSTAMIEGHAHEVGDGVWLLPTPPSPTRTATILTSLGERLAAVLAEWKGDVLVDCGRTTGSEPSAPLLWGADRLLLAVCPEVDAVQVTAAMTPELAADGLRPVSLAVIGSRPYRPREVADVLRLPLAAAVPWDPTTAAAVWSNPHAWRVRRSPLLRACGHLAGTLISALEGSAESADASGSETDRPSDVRAPSVAAARVRNG